MGGNFGIATTSGEWWRLGTSIFLHFGVRHLVPNMAVLWFFGRVVERMVGHRAFFIVYALGGLAGSVTGLIHNYEAVGAGASCATLGIVGCLLAVLIRKVGLLPNAQRTRLYELAAATLILAFLGDLLDGGIGGSHAAGLVTGFVAGVFLPVPTRKRRHFA